MKKILTYFFVVLGVIFFILIVGVAYLWFADPFGVRPLIEIALSPSSQNESVLLEGENTGTSTGEVSQDKNPALSPTQEQALEKIGIDPAKLPSSITPEMEKCFIEKLGILRVGEIKNGATPTPTEVFSTLPCVSSR